MTVLSSCIVPSPPKYYRYKPANGGKVQFYRLANGVTDVYYRFETKDSIDFGVSVSNSYFSGKMRYYYKLIVNNRKTSTVKVFCDSINLRSNLIVFKNDCQIENGSKEINPNDSVIFEHKEAYKLKKIIKKEVDLEKSKYDSLFLDITINGENYTYPFYQNLRNPQENNPF